MFKPRINSLAKSAKIIGVPPEKGEFGQMKYPTGNPGRKSPLSIKKPGK